MSDPHETFSTNRPAYRTETLQGYVVHFVDFGKPWATASRYHAQIDLPDSDSCWFVNSNDEASLLRVVEDRIAFLQARRAPRPREATPCYNQRLGLGWQRCGICPACVAG